MCDVFRGCALLLMAVTGSTEVRIGSQLVILDAPKGSTSSTVEGHLGFWIDEAAKTLVLADRTPLTVHRFDDHWISATRGDNGINVAARLEGIAEPGGICVSGKVYEEINGRIDLVFEDIGLRNGAADPLREGRSLMSRSSACAKKSCSTLKHMGMWQHAFSER
jgi:hypothetical protein